MKIPLPGKGVAGDYRFVLYSRPRSFFHWTLLESNFAQKRFGDIAMITAGVDIGSVATKALILRNHDILAREVLATGSQPRLAAKNALDKALQAAGLAMTDLAHVVSTGYGRRVVEFGEKTITEISACGLGTVFAGSPEGQVRTIIDLGGQDIKVIALGTDGDIQDFIMNDKCAAGTGRFLEVIAHALEVGLQDLGALALQSAKEVTINSTCTVFAESEVISLLSQDVRKEDILAGIHRSIADRILTMVLKMGQKDIVVFNGGGAKNQGLCRVLEDKLRTRIFVPAEPQFINALGAALEASHLG
jgi:predicted CoA-substrate-specific enzyme activase